MENMRKKGPRMKLLTVLNTWFFHLLRVDYSMGQAATPRKQGTYSILYFVAILFPQRREDFFVAKAFSVRISCLSL